MSQILKNKLKNLPSSPGVYFHKDIKNKIIYVGKAANLKNRVRQYFTNNLQDIKTIQLVKKIADFDYMVVDNEFDALFLEAEMIKRYKPKYNILLRDDKTMIYVRIDLKSSRPEVKLVRQIFDDRAKYIGPFYSSTNIRKVLKILRPIFPYYDGKAYRKSLSLNYYLGLEPGLEENKTTLSEYRKSLVNLIKVLEGKRVEIMRFFEKKMQESSNKHDFEQAKIYRDKFLALKALNEKIIFGDKEFLDISKDHALNELMKLFNLKKIPRRIEGYDISHMSGTNVVASMIVFIDGVSSPKNYRRFKIKIDQNNDFFNLHETLTRRFQAKNLLAWGEPDIILIDGGKGQLDAALKARDEHNLDIPILSLAKKREELIIDFKRSNLNLNENELKNLNGFIKTSSLYGVISLDKQTNLIKLMQRVRDESHRFAISYHHLLKNKL